MKTIALKSETKATLLLLLNTIQDLTIDEYVKKIPSLGIASIGEHTRHIIELFQQLYLGYSSGLINYDNRKRDIQIQNDINFASDCITTVIAQLDKPNKNLKIVSVYNNQEYLIDSNYLRELMYNLEHCIHHQAIIKIGLLCLGKTAINETFGVAKSTILYRNEYAE